MFITVSARLCAHHCHVCGLSVAITLRKGLRGADGLLRVPVLGSVMPSHVKALWAWRQPCVLEAGRGLLMERGGGDSL